MDKTLKYYRKEDLNGVENLEAILEQARDLYYNTGEVIMDDATYDYGMELLGKPNPIGAKPRQDTRFPVLKHSIPMSSLNKAKNQMEVDGWIKAMKIDEPWLVCEKKYDGLSLSVTYDNTGWLKTAILRGDGIEGENVIENAKKFVPNFCSRVIGHQCTIRGEVVISKSNFDKLPKNEYKNRRNCVSGIIRRLDGKHCELLDLICYDIIFSENPNAFKSEVIKLGALKYLKVFKIAQIWHYNPQVLIDLEKERDGEYLIDGVVIKHNDSEKTRNVGNGANGNPLLQIAYKFPAEEGVTHITDVKWEIGKTRKFCPVCEVEPVTIQGSTIGRVSLASYNQFKKLGLAKNKKVYVKRVHDVIPQISASETAKLVQDRELTPIEPITVCPHCNSPITIRVNDKGEETDLFCSNENCPEALIQILAENLKIKLKTKGFGESVCRQLVESGLVSNIADIYLLSAEQICAGTNMSEDRSNKFHTALHEALKSCSDSVFLDLFNLEGVAAKSLKEITSKYSIDEILELSLEECINILKKAKGSSFFNSKSILKSYIQEVQKLRA